MAKNIVFEYEGESYKLEYNEASIRDLEKNYGVTISDFESLKLSMLLDMFAVSMKMHHPGVKFAKAKEIFESFGDKEGLFAALVEMYADAVSAVLSEPAEGKATSWTMNEA